LDDKDLAEKVKSAIQKEDWFVELFNRIAQHRDNLISSALNAGDTDYEKGQIKGLTYAVNLPMLIITQNETDKESVTGADTSEPASKNA
jgi:hypothetical protein